jgi:hypothetical protein
MLRLMNIAPDASWVKVKIPFFGDLCTVCWVWTAPLDPRITASKALLGGGWDAAVPVLWISNCSPQMGATVNLLILFAPLSVWVRGGGYNSILNLTQY